MAYSAAGAGGIILLNLIVPSLLNLYHWHPQFSRWQKFLAHIVDLHARIVGPFTTRPVTTFFIQQISGITTLSPWWGFVLAQLILLAAAGYALGRLSEKLESPPFFSMAAYFLSFTVLFSFVTPNDSYDEAAQYLFLFLALNALVSARDISFAIFFFLALLTRETTALLLPGLLLLGWRGKKTAWKFALPILAFGVYYFSREAAADPNRFYYWARNFESGKKAFESIISFGIAFALPGALYLVGRRLGLMRSHSNWARACLWGIALNTPVVCLAAYARESRLFALPLVFLWPLCGAWVARIHEAWREGSLKLSPEPRLATSLLLPLFLTLFFYRPNYRFPGGYEILAPLYLLLLLAGCSLKRVPSPNQA